MATFLARATRVARLDTEIFDEIEVDPKATKQALAIILVVSLVQIAEVLVTKGVVLAITTFLVLLVSWLTSVFVAYLVGTRWLREPPRVEGIYSASQVQTVAATPTIAQFFRAVGFATVPAVFTVVGLLSVLTAAPAVSVFVSLASYALMFWVLFSNVNAVQHVLNYGSYWRAWAVLTIGGVAGWIVAGACVLTVGLMAALGTALVR